MFGASWFTAFPSIRCVFVKLCFTMSSDSEYEEEELYIFADFKNQLITQDISSPAIKIIGIETKNPIAEINGNVFKGTYDHAMGTIVGFEKDNADNIRVDPLFEESCKQRYKFLAKTSKILNFQRVYIEKKQQDQSGETAEKDTTKPIAPKQKPNLKINVTYEDAIRQFPVCGQEN